MNFSFKHDKIILIDGGLGTTLYEYDLDILNDPLWLIIDKKLCVIVFFLCLFFLL